MGSCQSKKNEMDLQQLVKELINEQQRLTAAVEELRKGVEDLRNENAELKDEIKVQNFVLNSIPFRTEVLN